jgi:hypothetical protein
MFFFSGLNSSFKRRVRPFSARRSRPILSSYAIANSLKNPLSGTRLNVYLAFNLVQQSQYVFEIINLCVGEGGFKHLKTYLLTLLYQMTVFNILVYTNTCLYLVHLSQ